MELRGQAVLVTGASRGIGAAIARAFAAAGANVAVNYRQSAQEAQAVVRQCRGSRTVKTLRRANGSKRRDLVVVSSG